MLIGYILAVLTGLLLAGIINIEFIKKDISPVIRLASVIVNTVAMAGFCLLFVYFFGLTYRFIVYTMLTVNLLLISNYDIREQSVSRETVIVSVICALAVLVYNKDSVWWDLILTGIGFTAVFILISRITRSAIGIGDAFITGVIGLYLGFFHTVTVIFLALLLGGVISIILFVMKKVSRKTPLPFAPFLAAGFLVSIIL